VNQFESTMEILSSTRSIRHYESRPVERDLLESLVRAGTYASNPRNTQPWRFIVVDEPTIIAELGEYLVPRVAELDKIISRIEDPVRAKVYKSGAHLLRNFGASPALIFVCSEERDFGPGFDSREAVLSAVHAAAQNILIAARAANLGAAYTTFHIHAEERFNTLLNIPQGVKIDITIPVGHPSVKFGPVNRKATSEVMHWNRHP